MISISNGIKVIIYFKITKNNKVIDFCLEINVLLKWLILTKFLKIIESIKT